MALMSSALYVNIVSTILILISRPFISMPKEAMSAGELREWIRIYAETGVWPRERGIKSAPRQPLWYAELQQLIRH